LEAGCAFDDYRPLDAETVFPAENGVEALVGNAYVAAFPSVSPIHLRLLMLTAVLFLSAPGLIAIPPLLLFLSAPGIFLLLSLLLPWRGAALFLWPLLLLRWRMSFFALWGRCLVRVCRFRFFLLRRFRLIPLILLREGRHSRSEEQE